MTEPDPMNAVRRRITLSHGMLLNLSEATGLIHFPHPKEVSNNLTVAEHGAPPPTIATTDIHFPLGVNRYRGHLTEVGISSDWSTRHLALFTATGYGKTNLLVFTITPHLDQGGGLILIDFKGDCADRLVERIPKHRINDVIWFDPSDSTHSPAFNPLKRIDAVSDESAIGGQMMGFHRLFVGHSEFGPQMIWYGRNGLRTMRASEGEKTLHNLMRFYDEPAYRDEVLATLKDRDLRRFWSRKLRQATLDGLLSRLSAFLDRPTIRDIVAQSSLIDFRRMMHEQKIFIARLEKSRLQEATAVIGAFLFSTLQLTAMSRPPQDRSLMPFVIDEFPNLAGPGMATEPIETLFREGRSYRSPLWVTAQEPSSLKPEVLKPLLGNVGTLGCGHLGQLEAQFVQRELGNFDAEDCMNLDTGEFIFRVGSAEDSFNTKIPLAETRHSFRDAIIAYSREHYYRKRSEIEAILHHSSLSPGIEDKLAQGQPSASSQPNVTPDGLRMLEHILNNSEETVSANYRSLGFSGYRGAKTAGHLIDKNLVIRIQTNLAKGNRRAVFLVPTMAAFEIMNKKPLGARGGPVHRYFQNQIATRTQELGFEARIEHHIPNGGWVDVHLEKEGVFVAVEIGIHSTPSKELHNIQKCLSTYDRILALYLDPALLQKTKALFVKNASDGDEDKVSFVELGRWAEELTV